MSLDDKDRRIAELEAEKEKVQAEAAGLKKDSAHWQALATGYLDRAEAAEKACGVIRDKWVPALLSDRLEPDKVDCIAHSILKACYLALPPAPLENKP